MTIQREEQDGYALMKIQGPMTVQQAAALHEEMRVYLNDYDGLILDLDKVSECDTAGIQLLCSARLTAEGMSKRFNVTRASQATVDIIARAGFDPDTILGSTNLG